MSAPLVAASTVAVAGLSTLLFSAAALRVPLMKAMHLSAAGDAVSTGKNLEIGFENTVALAAYLVKQESEERTPDWVKNQERYTRYFSNSRSHTARELAYLQDMLERRTSLKSYKANAGPIRVVRAKGDPFVTRFPRKSDFGAPVTDPFATPASARGMTAGDLEFKP